MRVNFSTALEWLQAGYRVSRAGWNGKGMWISIQRPDAHSKMSLPYIYMKTADNQLVPWLASQTDILANDWVQHSLGLLQPIPDPTTTEESE